MTKNTSANGFSFYLFVVSVAGLIFLFGITVGKNQIFPYQVFQLASNGYQELLLKMGHKKPWYYTSVTEPEPVYFPKNDQAYQGLNLITRMGKDHTLVAEVLDMDRRKVHQWAVDWFELWPEATHVPDHWNPRSKPGTHLHGALIMEDGGLVFNFEHQGLVRLDCQGKVVWRLPYQTHHSVQRQDDGNLWVCGQKYHSDPDPRFPNRIAPFEEYTIVEVSPDGQIREQFSVAELLQDNGLMGLLYMANLRNRFVQMPGDRLHLNDVEPFPDSMKEDFFHKGDILVSLRNISTVFVFNRYSRQIKFVATGWFVRQHDPDFIDGNRFSVFDNNSIAPGAPGRQSRIVIVSARERTAEVFFEGTLQTPFYTDILGKHQWLPNGNLLITESMKGRGFEINPDGEIVWEYFNYVDTAMVGIVEEVQRLPLQYGSFFKDSNLQDEK